jgi:hypothetical protein
MLDRTQDVVSLTNFKRHTSAHLKRMRRRGEPLVLTVNGKAELVVQDAVSYQRWLAVVDCAEAIVRVRASLDSLQRGEGQPLVEVFADLRREHGLSN